MRGASILIALLITSCGGESITEEGIEITAEKDGESIITHQVTFEIENGDTINKTDQFNNQSGLWKHYWDQEKTLIHYEKFFESNELLWSKEYDSTGTLRVEFVDGVSRIY